jgi:heme a synthase
VALGAVVVNIISGASVRLSGSGLGCPDWPRCTRRSLTPPLSLHPVIEFTNRIVVVLLVVTVATTLVGSLLRQPHRRDLVWLSGGLVVGVLGEAVVGAVVVASKLNPYVVMGHFLVGMAILADATVLVLAARDGGGRGVPMVGNRVMRLSRAMLVGLATAIVAGTATTGAGPHAGGPGAKRIPEPFADMARTHSLVVIVTGALLLVLLGAMSLERAPERAQARFRVLLIVVAVQGAIGYTQYLTHVPAVLVGIHVAGARSEIATSNAPASTALSTTPSTMPAPVPVETEEPVGKDVVEPDRPWLVIVWNDPVNLMSYVTYVFQKLFGYSRDKATRLMLDVHHKGRAVVTSGPRERAEHDAFRLHEYGLWATLEQAG